jgi:glycosyltransferase involved in cell wall biosynthesis
MSLGPNVSVVIPSFNAAQFISLALNSVICQKYCPLQVVVVDDGSVDDTVNIVRNYLADNVVLVRQQNKGPAVARNVGLQQAKGRWCIFLDADDEIESDFIEAQVSAGEKADASLVFGNTVMFWPDGRKISRAATKQNLSHDEALADVLGSGWYPPHAILWRSDFMRSIGGWNESLRRNEDGELIARALLQRPIFAASQSSNALYRQHSAVGRVSARKDEAAIRANLTIGLGLAGEFNKDRGWPLATAALGKAMIELAEEAYRLGYVAVGREAEKLGRELGASKPGGSLANQLGSRVLGMRRKASFSRTLHRLKHFVARSN